MNDPERGQRPGTAPARVAPPPPPPPPTALSRTFAGWAYGNERARLDHEHGQSAGPAPWPPPEVGPAKDPQPTPKVAMCGTLPPLGPFHDQPAWSAAHACVLDAGHPGWHCDSDGAGWSREPADELELGTAGLTAGQEIRARALDMAANRLLTLGANLDLDADDVIRLAERFTAYIAVGDHSPTPTSTVEQP